MQSATRTLKIMPPPVAPGFSGAEMNAFKSVGSNGNSLNAGLGASFVQKKGMTVMKNVVNDLKGGKLFDVSMVVRLINDFMVSCKNNEDQFITLARLKDPEQYTYAHAVNVCIYSMALGSKLQYKDNQILRLGMAAFLHDIGEVKLPERMIGKAAKYTGSEQSAMQRHPLLGYEILKRDPSIPEDVLLGVLHHHERLDGSGYPSGHSGRFIHPLGKIIALAETYDAMTSVRSNAESITPTEALKAIYSLAGKHYEPNVVKALITLLGMCPMGSLVRLSGGSLAVVLSKNKEDLSKPKVIIVTDPSGKRVSPFVVNLYGDPEKREIMMSENPVLFNIDPNKYIQEMLLNGKGL